MQKSSPKKKIFSEQPQHRPGYEFKMKPAPQYDNHRPGSNKLENKKCIVTGGDSGIGRAVAIAFAKEGADVAILYLKEEKDAELTAQIISETYSRECLLVHGDLGRETECRRMVKRVLKKFSHVDVLVNNAAVQYPAKKLGDISKEQLVKTFSVNIFSYFWVTKAALPHMKEGSCIINTSSVTAYRGSAELLDYSSTKGAIVSFTRSLAANLAPQKIRVNGVAPGPIWTPLIPSTFKNAKATTFGTETPLKRPGQPVEVASSFVFLASEDASYMSGQFLHPNGGEIVNT